MRTLANQRGDTTAVQAAGATAPADVEFSGPIIDGRISSAFGKVRGSIRSQPQRGIDLVAARGTPVHAPAAGTVLIATEAYPIAPNYGTVVVLGHGDGWQTLYAHLDLFEVTVGQRVAHGQPIGQVGATGKATGPHVHVEVLRHGERLDPATVIKAPVAAR